MAGLDLPIKLRRGLGNGNAVPAEELAKRLSAFDADKDGAVTRAELVQFLIQGRVGGPWFCEVLSRTLWKFVEQRLAATQPVIQVQVLGRIINFAMTRAPRPERRYEITPEGMAGYKPMQPLKRPGEAASSASADGMARPRATAPRGPGAPGPVPARAQSTTPGRPGAPSGAAPRRPVAAPARPIPRRPGPRR